MRPLASNAKCLCFAGWHYVLIGTLDDADWLKIVARDIRDLYFAKVLLARSVERVFFSQES